MRTAGTRRRVAPLTSCSSVCTPWKAPAGAAAASSTPSGATVRR